MQILKGKVSTFGGAADKGMIADTGLALYEPTEAAMRPDLFFPDHYEPKQPTWKLLNPDAMYCAMRFKELFPTINYAIGKGRIFLQQWPVKIINPTSRKFVIAWMVDCGPASETSRLIDVSPGIAKLLELETDYEVEVEI